MEYVQKAERLLRGSGYRVTPQRQAVLAFLDGNHDHPSIEDITKHVHEQMPSVSVSTVYQTMHDLESLGLVTRLDSGSSMRFDPNISPHGHLICSRCGAIIDILLDEDTEGCIERTIQRSGCFMEDYHIDARGLCPSCRDQAYPPEDGASKESA